MESVISLPCLSESVKLRGSPMIASGAGCWSTTVSTPSTSSKPLEGGAYHLARGPVLRLGQVWVGMRLCLPEPPSGQLLFPPCSPA